MKLFKRCHATLCLSLLLAFCFSLTAFAAKSTTLAAVPSVTVRTSSESAVSLTWKKASGATAYEVYMRTEHPVNLPESPQLKRLPTRKAS